MSVTRAEFQRYMRAASKAALAGWIAEHPGETPFKHYALDAINKYAADFEKAKSCYVYYKIIIGERSNGKTYACLAECLYRYFRYGEQFAYVRRHDVDFKAKRGASLFAGHVSNNLIYQLSGGQWTDVYYYSGRWYLSREDEDEKGRITTIRSDEPIGFAFAINTSAHDKSSSFPRITTIVFDEFIEPSDGSGYLFNEFVTFCNLLSTIIRLRTNVTVYMLANTVNRNGCPYFKEMGLSHLKELKPGHIQGYTYEDDTSGKRLGVVLEYVAPQGKSKASNIYFAFDNPSLQMVKNGSWEIPNVPHIPIRIRPNMIQYRAYIRYDGDTIAMQVVQGTYHTKDEDGNDEEHYADFLAVVPWTGKIKNEDSTLIYSPIPDPRPNCRRNIRKPYYPEEQALVEYIRADKVFFADNETGNTFTNYLHECKLMVI